MDLKKVQIPLHSPKSCLYLRQFIDGGVILIDGFIVGNLFEISSSENQAIATLSKNALQSYKTLEEPSRELNIKDYSDCLPERLKGFVHECLADQEPYFLIEGLNIDDGQLGPTPSHWKDDRLVYTKLLEFAHCIIASLVGQPGGYKTHQNGSMVSNIFPVKSFESYQQGFGSLSELVFHTEDAFDENCASYFSLMCLRNRTKTPTTLFPTDLSCLPARVKDELYKEQFTLTLDDSHTGIVDVAGEGRDAPTPSKTYEIAILNGPSDAPNIRIDPVNIDLSGLSDSAKHAFDYLCQRIEQSKQDINLSPGQIVFVNNKKLPHGRRGFEARYDGFDRWLTRVLLFDGQNNSSPQRAKV